MPHIVSAVGQKVAGQPLTEIREGDLYFCLEYRLVTVRDQEIALTAKEFDILALLIMNPKRVFTYELITDLVWNEDCTYYSRKACVGDTEIELTVKEYDALYLLILNRNRILTYETLARQIWGEEYIDITTKTIHNLMNRVRHKLQISPDSHSYIVCVRGVGYKFDAGTKKGQNRDNFRKLWGNTGERIWYDFIAQST